jgi:hypothetical protein
VYHGGGRTTVSSTSVYRIENETQISLVLLPLLGTRQYDPE